MDPQTNTHLVEEVCKPNPESSLDKCLDLDPVDVPTTRENKVGRLDTQTMSVKNVELDMRGKRSHSLLIESCHSTDRTVRRRSSTVSYACEKDRSTMKSERRQKQSWKMRRQGEKARLEVVTSFKNSEHAPAVTPESPEDNIACPLCNGSGFCDAEDVSRWTARSDRFNLPCDELITLPHEQAYAETNLLPDELPPYGTHWKAMGD